MIEPSIEPTNNIDDINAENLVSENTELISDETSLARLLKDFKEDFSLSFNSF